MQVYCSICGELTNKRLQEHQRLDCKGPQPDPVEPLEVKPEPVKPVKEPKKRGGLSQVERNKRYRQGNAEYKRKHREYMREYMRKKRAQK